jgi:peptidoglycan/xylan/chitin deacetylase (PgdA/CDA1 family)
MLKSLKAAGWRMLAASYYYSGLPSIRHSGQVAILTYHRIVSDGMVRDQYIQPGMYVRAETFESHAAYLQERFNVLGLEDLLERWRTNRLDEKKSYCVITFDDGWQDNYQYAFPVLKRYGLPATIFLATEYIGTSRWFWPDQITHMLGRAHERMGTMEVGKAVATVLSKMGEPFTHTLPPLVVETLDSDALIDACKALQPDLVMKLVNRLRSALGIETPDQRVLLDWSEIQEMARQGFTFGSHSCSHRIMTHISDDDAKKELRNSWEAMLMQQIKPLPVFCYPNGNCNQDIKDLTRDNGYVAALGCERGLEGRRPADLFSLKRISLHEDIASSISLLALRLSGFR